MTRFCLSQIFKGQGGGAFVSGGGGPHSMKA